MEHTELPWNNPKYTRRDGNNACWIMDGGKRPKAICRCCGPNAEANAEYIVRACNAFPALQVAVEAAIIDFDVTMKMPTSYDRGCRIGEIIGGLERASKAALAAGGE